MAVQETLNILGTRVSALNMDGAVSLVESWLQSGDFGRYVCVTGVHGIMEGLSDLEIRRIHNAADACVPDGMPLSWVGWLKGYKQMDRVYGPDLMLALLAWSAERGYTQYFYGGKDGVAEELEKRMRAQFPGLKVVGVGAPPFRPLDPQEEQDAIDEIGAHEPDFLWIGLSTPKQERLMASLSPRIRARVMLGVGAAFDFHTGLLSQAPRWMMRCGLEWAYRLAHEPRRLGRRYLVGNPRFLFHLFCQFTGVRRYPVDDV